MIDPLTFISLFAGIGGMDLGLERAGMRCVGQVEIDDYASRILAKHWPDVPRWRDVRDVGGHNLPACDLIAGGFPCQDISSAGKRAGIDGERSGLWSEYARIVRELRPRYVLVENVTALLGRGVERVLGDLAACGYDCEWQCIPAAAVGAPHIRDRIFLMGLDSNTTSNKHRSIFVIRHEPPHYYALTNHRRISTEAWWQAEPDVGRVAHGVPARVDRLRGLGNAVVPQVAEYIGRMIVQHAEATS